MHDCCKIFGELLKKYNQCNWNKIFQKFYEIRQKDANAILDPADNKIS